MAKTRLNGHLTKKQIADIKDKLLAEAERIQTKYAVEKTHLEENLQGSKDEVDCANDNILMAQNLRFASREALYLKKILKTLKKVDSDEFGLCEECGAQISFQRLMARPTSDMCISCKEESEREELQSAEGRVSKSLGKTITLARA